MESLAPVAPAKGKSNNCYWRMFGSFVKSHSVSIALPRRATRRAHEWIHSVTMLVTASRADYRGYHIGFLRYRLPILACSLIITSAVRAEIGIETDMAERVSQGRSWPNANMGDVGGTRDCTYLSIAALQSNWICSAPLFCSQ